MLAVLLVAGSLCSAGLNAADPVRAGRAKLVVVAEPENGGRVDGGGEFAFGSVVDVHAFPREGYVFSGWRGSVINPSNPVTRTHLTAATQRLTAVFEPARHLLTATVVPVGAGSVEGTGYRDGGGTPDITATPAAGYEFDRWEGPVAKTGEAVTNLKSAMTGPVKVTAYFKPSQSKHTVTVMAEPVNGGKVSQSGDGSYGKGESVKITAVPATGFLFAGWSGPVSSPGRPSTTLFVTGDTRVVANFRIDRGMIDAYVSPANAGRVTGELRARPVGVPAIIVAEPAPGYKFVRWEGPVSDRTSARTTITPVHAKIVSATAIFEPAR